MAGTDISLQAISARALELMPNMKPMNLASLVGARHQHGLGTTCLVA